jgi:hypothetical protein
MKKILKQLKKAMEKEIGGPCKDRDPYCASCISWSAYETLEHIAEND